MRGVFMRIKGACGGLAAAGRVGRVILSMGLAAAVFLSVAGCKTELEKNESNISELRTNVYAGGDAAMRVTAITGRRENPYVLDGHCGQTRDFTVITIEPTEFDYDKIYSYKLTVGDTEYTGELARHPFGRTFSADIEAKADGDTLTCSVTDNGAESQFVLTSVRTPEMIDENKAIEIAAARLKKPIASLTGGGRLNAEIYIRLMANPIDNSGGYYWYVAYVNESAIYAVLIEPVSMEILAVRD
ncbi:MAG: hypothetical protein LBP26_02545 [Clostridiales bacterium]|jgi:hypothetical protein|nr:hypothetical protein [Clostridiales bacterium]